MPELRQSLRRGRFWIILIAAVVLAAAAIIDWTKPPRTQGSVYLYERALIQPYRSFVRPVTKSFVHCRFVPTCSQYSVIAVQTYGFPKGFWLTMKRVCRCGPWVKPGTLDLLPPARAL